MMHQGTMAFKGNNAKIKTEKIAKGNFTDIIHIHLKKSSVLEEHLSKTEAVLILLEGEVDYIAHDKRHKLGKGDYINFEANILHSLEAFEDSHLILIK